MTANEIRTRFLNFFASKGHKIIASDSLVPKNDPTVLFTSAGMNQFKRQFLGHISDFRRATTCQKCLRTDDLDKVGKTAFHHSFFEMLGNFSFGDYFKEETIAWAWEFLTRELKIPPEKLWVSVYIEDNEAFNIWKEKIRLPAERILVLSDKDNFWPAEARAKGPNGPCGPCSEIFFDYGKQCGCQRNNCNPVCICGRFTEVWNLVFTQFERKDNGVLEPLPNKNIDTGLGLERLSAVMQNVTSNFETDLFKPIIEAIKKEASLLGGKVTSPENDFALKALADHLRAIVFAICDGVLPSNEERGYVVKKLIRRCSLLYRQAGLHQSLIYKIVPVVAEVMKEPYPEVLSKRESISAIVKKEEEAFSQILIEYVPLIEAGMKKLKHQLGDGKELSNELARLKFKAYDTFGLPAEITDASAAKLGVKIDEAIFTELMNEQKKRSQETSKMAGDVFIDQDIKVNLPATEFVGYQEWETSSKILKIFRADKETPQINEGEAGSVILDRTPFYAESGGQIGDSGTITKDGSKIEVLDTQAIEKNIIHNVRVKSGEFRVGDTVLAVVGKDRRLSIARNHTATHLLQAALRKVLGEQVQQQGSLVSEERLRFDFTHFKALEKKEVDRVEEVVNGFILQNDALEKQEMPLDQARQSGALAFFAEKYDETVRVISIGNFSRELCAGTHLSHTGEIGLFKITSESSIAQGVRRIEATTGKFAYKMLKEQENIIADISAALNVPPDKIIPELQKKISYTKGLEKTLKNYKLAGLKSSIDKYIQESTDINGVKFIAPVVDDRDAVKIVVDLIKEKVKFNCLVAASTGNSLQNEIFWAIGSSADLCEKGLDASKLIKDIALEIGGSGGGRKDFAQAGGNKPAGYGSAIEKLKRMIREILAGH